MSAPVWPSMSTVQAPHTPCSQPRCVPVRPQISRNMSARLTRGAAASSRKPAVEGEREASSCRLRQRGASEDRRMDVTARGIGDARRDQRGVGGDRIDAERLSDFGGLDQQTFGALDPRRAVQGAERHATRPSHRDRPGSRRSRSRTRRPCGKTWRSRTGFADAAFARAPQPEFPRAERGRQRAGTKASTGSRRSPRKPRITATAPSAGRTVTQSAAGSA